MHILSDSIPSAVQQRDTLALREQPSDAIDGYEAPLQVIRDAVPAPDLRSESNSNAEADVIQRGIVSEVDATYLLALFQRHYGRWVGWNEAAPNSRSPNDIRDPLLLCVCYLIAGRHTKTYQARARSEALSAEAKNLLGSRLLQTEQPYSFFQAALVLSLWSTTAGQSPLGLDAWSISGYALQQASVSELFNDRRTPEEHHSTYPERSQVHSHLQLAHLHACVSLRRRARLGFNDIERARLDGSMNSFSNFEARMLAELHLYWIVHECSIEEPVRLPRAQNALQKWKSEWSSLFAQPRHQFLQMGFDFAQLLLYERSLNARSTNVRQSLLAEMLRLSEDILDGAMNAADTRTEHLTDHVYHVITFAAITMSRLMYKYGSLLLGASDVDHKHEIVARVVVWLHSIGLDAHVARTMGDTIRAVHRKLFPERHSTPRITPHADAFFTDTGAMPDFLGLDPNFDWDNLLPDWQSLTSEAATYDVGHIA